MYLITGQTTIYSLFCANGSRYKEFFWKRRWSSTAGLDTGKWSPTSPGSLTPEERPPENRLIGAGWDQPCDNDEKNNPLQGIESRSFAASHYLNYTNSHCNEAAAQTRQSHKFCSHLSPIGVKQVLLDNCLSSWCDQLIHKLVPRNTCVYKFNIKHYTEMTWAIKPESI